MKKFIKKLKSVYDKMEATNTARGGLYDVIEAMEKAKPPINLIHLEHERFKWSKETFPEATATSSLFKLIEEVGEIRENIQNGVRDPEEYADALMCLFDSAGRDGIGPGEITDAFKKKLAINKGRSWEQNSDGSYSHVKWEKGQKVNYSHMMDGDGENGMIKEVVSKDHVRVVFHCNDDWDNFEDYTGQLTSVNNLREGWN